MRTHNILSGKRISKRNPCYASWPGTMITTHKHELPMSGTYIHDPKDVQAIAVLLYISGHTVFANSAFFILAHF